MNLNYSKQKEVPAIRFNSLKMACLIFVVIAFTFSGFAQNRIYQKN
jgi:hypothetical protein